MADVWCGSGPGRRACAEKVARVFSKVDKWHKIHLMAGHLLQFSTLTPASIGSCYIRYTHGLHTHTLNAPGRVVSENKEIRQILFCRRAVFQVSNQMKREQCEQHGASWGGGAPARRMRWGDWAIFTEDDLISCKAHKLNRSNSFNFQSASIVLRTDT